MESVLQTENVPWANKTCGSSGTGECRMGTQTCESNGFYGSCSGAVNPVVKYATVKTITVMGNRQKCLHSSMSRRMFSKGFTINKTWAR